MDEEYFSRDAVAAPGADTVLLSSVRSGSLSDYRAAGHGGGKFSIFLHGDRKFATLTFLDMHGEWKVFRPPVGIPTLGNEQFTLLLHVGMPSFPFDRNCNTSKRSSVPRVAWRCRLGVMEKNRRLLPKQESESL